MCGRFADQLAWEEEWTALLGTWPEDVPRSYNKSPGDLAAVFTAAAGRAMRWGLVPAWSRTPVVRYATFNARIEEANRKPAFRAAWSAGRRCLIPVLGYYEWQRCGAKARQPYFISEAAGRPLLLGGLWEPWSGEGGELLSCTILTREPVPGIAHLHDRMPVVVEPEGTDDWLRGSVGTAREIASDDISHRLAFRPVGDYVNDARNDGPACLEPPVATESAQRELDL